MLTLWVRTVFLSTDAEYTPKYGFLWEYTSLNEMNMIGKL